MALVVAAKEHHAFHDDVNLELLEEPDECSDAARGRRLSVRGKTAPAIFIAGLFMCAAISFSRGRSSRLPRMEIADPTSFASFYSAMGINPALHDVKQVNYSTAGLSEDHQEAARHLGVIKKLISNKVDKQIYDLRTAACVIDSTQAAYFLERAGLAVIAATATCRKGKSHHVTTACVADISAVISSIAFVAEYVSEAVLMCSKTLHYVACVYDETADTLVAGHQSKDSACRYPYHPAVRNITDASEMQARCSGGVSGIIANTARISTSASFIAANCRGALTYDKPIGDSVWQMDRRLQNTNLQQPTFRKEWPTADEIEWPERVGQSAGENTIHKTMLNRVVEVSSCGLDAAQTTSYLADFGIFIDGATKACGPSRYSMGALHPHMRDAHNVYCAMSILDTLEAVFMASSFISSAVAHCAPGNTQQALCISGAVGLGGAVSGLSKSVMNVYGACETGKALGKFLNPKYMGPSGQLKSYEAAKKVTAWNDVLGRRRRKVPGVK